jgi:uncharacterized protein YqjF (DUF2071 family)
VYLDGVPGVWFFSLDASSPLVVWGARTAFSLPYFRARMRLEQEGKTIHFHSERKHSAAPPAEFEAAWNLGGELPPAKVGSLDFFLVERYCLYAEHCGQLYRAQIHHLPWPLRQARVSTLHSTMMEAHGLPTSSGSPLLHGQGEPLRVEVWPLKRV